jgi:hypothetical protein
MRTLEHGRSGTLAEALLILLAGLLLVCLLMIGIGGLLARPTMVDLSR